MADYSYIMQQEWDSFPYLLKGLPSMDILMGRVITFTRAVNEHWAFHLLPASFAMSHVLPQSMIHSIGESKTVAGLIIWWRLSKTTGMASLFPISSTSSME
jgi:hypothetical protein